MNADFLKHLAKVLNEEKWTDDSAAKLRQAATRMASLEAAVEGLIMEWDKFTRYGSPIAKAANERVAYARSLLEKT